MTRLPVSDDDDFDRPRPLGRRALLVGLTVLSTMAVLGFGVYALTSNDPGQPRKPPEIVQVRIVPPPPPPPPPTPPPPREPPPDQKIMEQPPEKPMEAIKEAKAEEPPSGPLSLDAKGDGPPDGFGLSGKQGGRGLLSTGGGGGTRWGWYASIVQSQIEAALQSNAKTRDAVMRIEVRVWADGTGRVSRVQLVTSTGDTALDAVLRSEVLGALVLREPPPKDMPMPISMRITARKAS